MFINKEGKLFGKISIIDIFVALILIVAAFGVYTRFFTVNETVQVQEHQIEYKMKISWVRDVTYEALLKKGLIMDKEKESVIGEIVDVQAEEIFEEQKKSDGTLALVKVPERLNVIITVRGDGFMNDTGYFVGDADKRISVGSSFTIATKYAETSGTVVSVEEIK